MWGRKNDPGRRSIACPSCLQVLTWHWHRNHEDEKWELCQIDCGWVTCMPCQLFVNLDTGEARRASLMVYDA